MIRKEFLLERKMCAFVAQCTLLYNVYTPYVSFKTLFEYEKVMQFILEILFVYRIESGTKPNEKQIYYM